MEKRSLQETFREKSWSSHQVDSLCHTGTERLKEKLDQYLQKVDHGNNRQVLNQYIQLVNNRLGIDNSLLIIRE